MTDLQYRVYEFLTRIPKGKVVTYGTVAAHLGNKNLARVVGNLLHVNPDPIGHPCFRVVNSKGCLAAHFGDGGPDVQRSRLEADGIEVIEGRVDLEKYGWIPEDLRS